MLLSVSGLLRTLCVHRTDEGAMLVRAPRTPVPRSLVWKLPVGSVGRGGECRCRWDAWAGVTSAELVGVPYLGRCGGAGRLRQPGRHRENGPSVDPSTRSNSPRSGFSHSSTDGSARTAQRRSGRGYAARRATGTGSRAGVRAARTATVLRPVVPSLDAHGVPAIEEFSCRREHGVVLEVEAKVLLGGERAVAVSCGSRMVRRASRVSVIQSSSLPPQRSESRRSARFRRWRRPRPEHAGRRCVPVGNGVHQVEAVAPVVGSLTVGPMVRSTVHAARGRLIGPGELLDRGDRSVGLPGRRQGRRDGPVAGSARAAARGWWRCGRAW